MPILRLPLLASLLAFALGCHCADRSQRFSRAQLQNMENVKHWVDGHEHVIQVCIWEARLERMPPGHKHPIRFKGTVVRSYKGKWKVGDTISYWTVMESVRDDWTPNVGVLQFLFLDAHTQEPIFVDTGESFSYEAELEREIQFLLRCEKDAR